MHNGFRIMRARHDGGIVGVLSVAFLSSVVTLMNRGRMVREKLMVIMIHEHSGVYDTNCSGVTLSPSSYIIRLGTTLFSHSDSDLVIAYVDMVVPHPGWVSTIIKNDIGMLRLSAPVTFTDTIQPACLPTSDVDITQFKYCVATGFGLTNGSGM